MHGVFIASGPNFKENDKTGTILNIDIYPLCAGYLTFNLGLILMGSWRELSIY